MKVMVENTVKYAHENDEIPQRMVSLCFTVEGKEIDTDLLSCVASKLGEIPELYCLHGFDGNLTEDI